MKMRRIPVCVTLLVMLVGSLPNYASGASNLAITKNIQYFPSPSLGTDLTIPNGKIVVLPKDWNDMSVSDLAKIGIMPNSNRNNLISIPLASGAVPLSSSGSNGWVDINIVGSGLLISSWSTKANILSVYSCTFAVYWNSMTSIYATGPQHCYQSGPFYDTLPNRVIYPANGYACSSWVQVSGKPCEYISAN